jgi:hypothetical protein
MIKVVNNVMDSVPLLYILGINFIDDKHLVNQVIK